MLCLTACNRVESLAMRSVPYASYTAPELREISLTLASIARLLTAQAEALITAEGQLPLARGSDLPEAIARLRALPPRVFRKRFPAGGLVSVCYTLTTALDDLLACLKDLQADPHDRRAWAGFAAGGVAGLSLAVVIRHLRRAAMPVKLPRWMFGALLALLVGFSARRGHQFLSIRDRMSGLSKRLQLILRVLLLATTIFQDTNRHGPETGRGDAMPSPTSGFTLERPSAHPADVSRSLLGFPSLPLAAMAPKSATNSGNAGKGSLVNPSSDEHSTDTETKTAVPATASISSASVAALDAPARALRSMDSARAVALGVAGSGLSTAAVCPSSPNPLGGRRRWSRADLIGDLSDSEFDRHASAPSRRMLEATGLPKEAAELGTSRHVWLRLLKYFLDVVYAAADAGYSCELGARMALKREADAPWWGAYGRVARPVVTAGAAAWFALQPAAAAEKASSVLHDCGIEFVAEVWRAIDMPVLRLAAALSMPRLTVNRSVVLNAVACHVILQAPGALPSASGTPAAVAEAEEERICAARALPQWMEDECSWWESREAAEDGSIDPASGANQREPAVRATASATALASNGAYDASSDTDGGQPASGRVPGGPWSDFTSRPRPPQDVNILVYIHGGGFVGSSFASDVAVLGRWAKACPGLCVVYPHYSLSPEVRFPVALGECFRAYSAARRAADAAIAFGMRGRVVMFGESAGGNLAAAVCVRAASLGLNMPDRLVLAYPALNLNSAPSPSRALHLNDPIVPLRMLQRLAAAYMPNGFAGRFTRNPEVHPGLAPDEVLLCFPRTELVLGGLDPLLDDGIEFNSRLRRLGVPGEMLVYRALPHGFFTFSWLPPAAGAIDAVYQFLTTRDGLGLRT